MGGASAIKTNVRPHPTSFVGRGSELASLLAKLDEGARLVTIVGFGGLGKTRVATRFAEEHAAAYSDHGGGGAWFCDLTTATTAAHVHAKVASVLSITLRGEEGSDAATLVGRALARKKRLLLVLDNFEQVVDAAASTVEVWLREAPHARLLVTSRVPLGIPGEHLWHLEPLSISDGVELFAKRASELRAGLSIGEREASTVESIIRRLDAIPLAIELAAARMSVLSAAQLDRKLDESADVLVRRGDEGRHGSMRRVVEDSIEQLRPSERACLAGLAVFRGGFSLESMEAVLLEREGDVLAALERLVACSLVRVLGAGSGEPRFDLFETIREIAGEELDRSGARATSEQRHAHHYAERAIAARASELRDDFENFLAANETLSKAADAASIEMQLSLVAALGNDLETRGLFTLERSLADAAIRRAAGTEVEHTPAFGAALVARAKAERDLGSFGPSKRDFEDALARAEKNGWPAVESIARARIGEIIETEGATTEARVWLAKALEVGARAPSAIRDAEIHLRSAHSYRREGALGPASTDIERAIFLYRQEHADEGLAYALYEAAVIGMFAERFDESRRYLEEGLAVATTAGARQAEAAILSGLGVLDQEQGMLDIALEHHARAVAIFRDIENKYREASSLYYLAGAYLERNQPTDAGNVLDRSIGLFAQVGVPRYDALTKSLRALVFAHAGDKTRTLALMAEAERASAACLSESAIGATLETHRDSIQWLEAPATRSPANGRAAIERARERARQSPGDDPRLALRFLVELVTPARPSGESALVVKPDGTGFWLPTSSDMVDLSRRAPLTRIVAALVDKRIRAPGEGLDLDEILVAGWPGEKMTGQAGQNRVHVALTTLRNLGLRSHLVTAADGYRLTTESEVRLAAPTGSG